MELWEILVPKRSNDGVEFDIVFHRKWDNKVRSISGGLTVMRSAKGIWSDDTSGTIYEERMIPVRIMCTREDLMKILKLTKEWYKQTAIFWYKVSEESGIYR
jgi:hypothetical protein